MLNYTVAMQRVSLTLFLIAAAVAALPSVLVNARQAESTPGVPTAAASAVVIQSPVHGTVLQGKTPIVIGTDLPGFQRAELSFAYVDDPTGTWFLLYESNQPVLVGTTVEWDTGLISDGNYALRLVVEGTDGTRQRVEVSGLQVRNYSAVETIVPAPPASPPAPTGPSETIVQPVEVTTPSPVPPRDTPTPGIILETTAQPATPSALAPNPAVLQPAQVGGSIVLGVMVTTGAFALAGIYLGFKHLGRRQ